MQMRMFTDLSIQLKILLEEFNQTFARSPSLTHLPQVVEWLIDCRFVVRDHLTKASRDVQHHERRHRPPASRESVSIRDQQRCDQQKLTCEDASWLDISRISSDESRGIRFFFFRRNELQSKSSSDFFLIIRLDIVVVVGGCWSSMMMCSTFENDLLDRIESVGRERNVL